MSIICPHCKKKITTVFYKSQGTYDGIDYDPDESETEYECPKCGKEISQEDVLEL